MSNPSIYSVKCMDYKGFNFNDGDPDRSEIYVALTLEQAQFVRNRARDTNIWRSVYITGGPDIALSDGISEGPLKYAQSGSGKGKSVCLS